MRQSRSYKAWACAIAALVAAFYPLAQLALSAFADPAQSVEWLSIWMNGTLAWTALQTAWVCTVAAAVAIAASAPQAAVVSLYRFKGAFAVELAALAPLLLAPYAAAGAWAGLDLGAWSHGELPMAVQVGFSCAPWSYMALRVAISRLPVCLGEAAMAAGMTLRTRLVQVWAPLLSAPLCGAALFAIAKAIGDYGTAERNGAHTFGVAFHDMWNGSHSSAVAAAVALCAVVPAVLATGFASAWVRRHPPRQPAAAAGAAQWLKQKPSGALLAAIFAWSALCLGWSFVAPEWQYIVWAIDGKWMGWAKGWRVTRDALASAGSVAAVLTMACTACAICFRPSVRGGLPERLVWLACLNLFIPPMALALAWLSATADGSWLAAAMGSARNGTLPLLLAQSAKLAPFALLPVLDRISRENESLRDALHVAGMGQLQVALHVVRMVAPALVLGCAMVFIEAIKELEIAITLQHFGYQSPAIKIHAAARFHSERVIANWVLISQLLMLPALAVIVGWLARLNRR